jgi:uncharacterized protein GlcG (DUF336 family)
VGRSFNATSATFAKSAILSAGKIIGAIGVSGDTSEHDSQAAQAALDSLK